MRRIDFSRTANAKGRAMTRRQLRREKSARLFLALAFPAPTFGAEG